MKKEHMRKLQCFYIFVNVLLVIFVQQEIYTNQDTIQQTRDISSTSLVSSSLRASDADAWPIFHFNVQHTGFSPADAPTTNNILWNYQTNGAVGSSPVIYNGQLYIGSSDNNLYCLNADTGDRIWNYTTNDWILSTPAISNGKIYFGSHDQYVYCLDADTTDGIDEGLSDPAGVSYDLLWNYKTNGSITHSSPVVVDNNVYITSKDKNIYCLNATTGYKKWSYTTGSFVLVSPTVSNGRVFCGSMDNQLYCLDAETGAYLWSYATGSLIRYSSCVFIDEKILVGSNDANLYCLDATDGHKIWNFATGNSIDTSPAVANGYVYFGSDDKKMYCLNLEDGSLQWSFLTGAVIRSSPAIADGKIFFGSQDNKIYCLNAETGVLLWSYTTGGIVDSSPAIANGKLYIGSNDKKIYCFGSNQAPYEPVTPSGTVEGYVGIEYTYTTSIVSDPDDDAVQYYFLWGDKTGSGWVETPSAVKTWSHKGIYKVKVKVRDSHGEETNWSQSLDVSIADQPSMQLAISVLPLVIPENSNFVIIVFRGLTPVEGATVSFLGTIQVTDSNGRATFTTPSVPEDTTYIISAMHPDYISDTKLITVSNQVTEQPEQIGWIYGTVYAKESATPKSNVAMKISSADVSWIVYTDSSGNYYKSLAPGFYTVTASQQGYQSSVKENIEVVDKGAFDVSFELVLIQTPSSGQADSATDTIDYFIAQKATAGLVDVQITADPQNEKLDVGFYNDAVDIDVQPDLTDSFSFTVASKTPEQTGAFIIIEIDNITSFYNTENIDDIICLFDGIIVDRSNLYQVFDSTAEQLSWTGLIIDEKLYVFTNTPLSEHTITISSLVRPEPVLVVFGLFSFLTLVAVLFFFIPVYVLFFKKNKG